MKEHGQNTDNLLICGAAAFSGLTCNLVGALSKGWLRGVDLNHRPLGYENILAISTVFYGVPSCSLSLFLFVS